MRQRQRSLEALFCFFCFSGLKEDSKCKAAAGSPISGTPLTVPGLRHSQYFSQVEQLLKQVAKQRAGISSKKVLEEAGKRVNSARV